MGLFDFFKKKKKPEETPVGDLQLTDLKPGCMVDYDLKTWEVTACNDYDWGGGDITREWQLKSADDLMYLEKETDDEAAWSISRKIAFGRLGTRVAEHLKQNGDPPAEIVYEGTAYYLAEQGGGHFYKDGRGPGREFLMWSYEDDDGENYLTIEQWGEEAFEAAVGRAVEAYQFENILPAPAPPES